MLSYLCEHPNRLVTKQELLDAVWPRRFVTDSVLKAGIGKTAVVDAFVEQAATDGKLLVGHGRCIEQYSAGEPYFPVLEALSEVCRQPEGEQAASLLARYAPSWLAQLPWLSAVSGHQVAQSEALGPYPASDATRDGRMA